MLILGMRCFALRLVDGIDGNDGLNELIELVELIELIVLNFLSVDSIFDCCRWRCRRMCKYSIRSLHEVDTL